ncbi:hypothetical protein FIBSPDRAFT_749359 [Athelia psychrophila]|uniref:Uncharacterized protein n=1 Tax=Athelia psychrophila TaxID=1759441 RepID=A0A166EQT6_9AGAM|nr:hypothetical protein FIBSPDRAFT_749359 [Fibularhizoctonia sp. CBS 109695]
MEEIIRERGLWPENGLRAQCEGFKCVSGATDCCCRRLLFCQPDFQAQKSQLEEYITSCGHLCDFYPKYHCELNFIEQYWGAAKYRYRSSPKTSDMDAMEKNVIACLDDVPLLQIHRFANRSARFISGYAQGLTGAEAVWANRKYHGHRTLPADIIREIKGYLRKRALGL